MKGEISKIWRHCGQITTSKHGENRFAQINCDNIY